MYLYHCVSIDSARICCCACMPRCRVTIVEDNSHKLHSSTEKVGHKCPFVPLTTDAGKELVGNDIG